MKTTTILCASLAALAAVPATAQELFRFGLSANIAAPMNDISKKSANGYGLAGFAEIKITESTSMRIRYEYTMMGGKEEEVTANDPLVGLIAGAIKNSDSTMQMAMADYVFRSKDTGLYFFAGVGTTWWGVSVDSMTNGSIQLEEYIAAGLVGALDKSNSLCGSIGVGYGLTPNMGVEARYTKMDSKADYYSSQAMVQASFVFRF